MEGLVLKFVTIMHRLVPLSLPHFDWLVQLWRVPSMRSGMRPVAYAAGAGTMISISAYLIARLSGHDSGVFTREPQTVLDGPWYAGWFSDLGGAIWFACLGCLALAASQRSSRREALSMAAIITLLMGADDIFLLHDAVYPMAGLPELIVGGVYLGLIMVMVATSWQAIGQIGVAGVAAACMFWSISQVLDHLYLSEYLWEDGAKFIGICVWAVTWAGQARAALTESHAAES